MRKFVIFFCDQLQNLQFYQSVDWRKYLYLSMIFLYNHWRRFCDFFCHTCQNSQFIFLCNRLMIITFCFRDLLIKFQILFQIVCQNSWFSFCDQLTKFVIFCTISLLNSQFFQPNLHFFFSFFPCLWSYDKIYDFSFLMVVTWKMKFIAFCAFFCRNLRWFFPDRLMKIAICFNDFW